MDFPGLLVRMRQKNDSKSQQFGYYTLKESMSCSHEPDVSVAVPLYTLRHPLAGIALTPECVTGVVRSVVSTPESWLGIRVVVLHPWSEEGFKHTYFFQWAYQCGGPHCFPTVGMKRQWLAPAFGDPPSHSSPAHQICCNGWIFTISYTFEDDFRAADDYCLVAIQPDTTKSPVVCR